MSIYHCVVCAEDIVADHDDPHTYHGPDCPQHWTFDADCNGSPDCGTDCHADCCPTCLNDTERNPT